MAKPNIKKKMAPSTPPTQPPFVVRTLRTVFWTLAATAALYVSGIALVVTYPALEAHAIYMHHITLMSSVDALNTPEEFGFLPNQVRPFSLPLPEPIIVPDLPVPSQTTPPAPEETLHAWHVLPLNLYNAHAEALLAEAPGRTLDITASHGLSLLKNDPDARVVFYLHGASGTMASGVRTQAYRALSASDPSHMHVFGLDYRGYGLSSGSPSEGGVIADVVALVRFVMEVAGIPPERIVVYGQSLGTAIALGTIEHFASQEPPVEFAGLVLTAGMVDVETLIPSYRVNGLIPALSPLGALPSVLGWLASKLRSTWKSGQRLQRIVEMLPRHHITLVHAEDDLIVPPVHAHTLYRYAVNGTLGGERAMSGEDLDGAINQQRRDLGTAGSRWEWKSERGVLNKAIIPVGEHDKLTYFPITSQAVLRAFQSRDPTFGQ